MANEFFFGYENENNVDENAIEKIENWENIIVENYESCDKHVDVIDGSSSEMLDAGITSIIIVRQLSF